MRLTDDLHPDRCAGRHAHRAEVFAGLMKAAPYTLHEFQLNDVQVLAARRCSVVVYKVHEQLTVDGEPLTLDAADASVWVQRE